MSNIHIFCGAGGVGKTTISAAYAIHLSQEGQRVAIITIDPAKRLADAFGLETNELTNSPKAIPNHPNVKAMILQPTQVFDDFVKQHSSSAESKDLFNNRYYKYASQKMSGIHEYMAMIRLMQLVDTHDYDAIVLDTPPAKNALDFLHAPKRLQGLLSNTALNWLKPKASWSALQLGIDVVQRTINSIIGSQTLTDLFDFFECFSVAGARLSIEASRIETILSTPSTKFYLVCTPQLRAVFEAASLKEDLTDTNYNWSALLINRMPKKLKPLSKKACESSFFLKLFLQYQQRLKAAQDAIERLDGEEFNIENRIMIPNLPPSEPITRLQNIAQIIKRQTTRT